MPSRLPPRAHHHPACHSAPPAQELERRHAAERDAWRRETAEAVDAAREEAAALADERLDATTKQTLLENEEMAGAVRVLCRLHREGEFSAAAQHSDRRVRCTAAPTPDRLPGELQYQGRHAQAVLARCAALQAEAAELRAALGVARGTEEELAQKVVAAERTVASVVRARAAAGRAVLMCTGGRQVGRAPRLQSAA